MYRLFCFIVIIFFVSVSSFAQGGNNNSEQRFISKLSKTYNKHSLNDTEYNQSLLFKAFNNQNIPLDTIGTYEYLPFYRVEFKKLTRHERQHLQRRHYFSYMSTQKVYGVEIYVFKDSKFYGTLRIIENNDFYFIHDDDSILRARATTFYNQIYQRLTPEMMIYIRRPFSEMFCISNGKIYPIRYENNNWNISDINVFYTDKRFNFDKVHVESQRDKPLRWIE